MSHKLKVFWASEIREDLVVKFEKKPDVSDEIYSSPDGSVRGQNFITVGADDDVIYLNPAAVEGFRISNSKD